MEDAGTRRDEVTRATHPAPPPTSAELAAMLYAARTAAQSRSPSRLAIALAVALLSVTALFATNLADFPHNGDARPFLIGRGHELSSRRGIGIDEEIDMRRLKEVAVASALALTTAASAQNAVQWRVQDGGNGHWYATRRWSAPVAWDTARDTAVSQGAILACLNTSAEDQFVTALAVSEPSIWLGVFGPWLGATAQGPCTAGTSCFTWMDGTALTHTRWHPGNPDNVVWVGGRVGVVLWEPNWTRAWQDTCIDLVLGCGSSLPISAVFEWSADCNGDGIVDYGQILAGQLADTNQNGVPDTCEVDPCPGDITGNNSVDGVDLAALLAAWGGGKSQYDCDVDNDGLVGGSDLAVVLAGWGACP